MHVLQRETFPNSDERLRKTGFSHSASVRGNLGCSGRVLSPEAQVPAAPVHRKLQARLSPCRAQKAQM
jgi:hypothetical protein